MAVGLFKVGEKYTRAQVASKVALPPKLQGGNWNTGYRVWGGQVYVFCNVGTAGRTGHDYDNRWVENQLEWYGKTGTHRHQPLIKKMISGELEVHVFWRSKDSEPFTYAGVGRADEVSDSKPVRLRWTFN
jgi:hypothetical protein